MSEVAKKPASNPDRPIEDKSVKATDGYIRIDANFEVKENIYPHLRIVRNARNAK